MGVKITFTSGKTWQNDKASGYKLNYNEQFKSGTEAGYVIFFGKGKTPIHYKKRTVRSIEKY